MNTRPAFVHFWANEEFSLKKPYPGCIAWHPSRRAISMIRSPSRYALVSPRLNAKDELNAC